MLWQWMRKNTLVVFKYFFPFTTDLLYIPNIPSSKTFVLVWERNSGKYICYIYLTVKPKFELSLSKYKNKAK